MQFSQKDPRWALLAFPFTLGTYGCFIVALSCLTGKTPDNLLKLLLAKDCFNDKGELINAKAAFVLGFKRYQWLVPNTQIVAPIICETDFYAPEFPKHFFVALPNGQIIDPLTGLQCKNKYNIVSQRLFV